MEVVLFLFWCLFVINLKKNYLPKGSYTNTSMEQQKGTEKKKKRTPNYREKGQPWNLVTYLSLI